VNKKGIELAAGFIVILIVSLVMFGLATGLTYKLFCSSEGTIQDLDESASKELEQRLNSGARVQIPDAAKQAKQPASFCGGSFTPFSQYSLGIRNDFPAEKNFKIECAYKGYDEDGDFTAADEPCDAGSWKAQWDKEPFAITGKQKETKLIVIQPASGVSTAKHLFAIRVFFENNTNEWLPYGTQQIYFSLE
jgi:hypothetical protein